MFTIRWLVTDDATGDVIHDETVPVETAVIYGFEKYFAVLGRETTIRVEFDPALAVAEQSP